MEKGLGHHLITEYVLLLCLSHLLANIHMCIGICTHSYKLVSLRKYALDHVDTLETVLTCSVLGETVKSPITEKSIPKDNSQIIYSSKEKC